MTRQGYPQDDLMSLPEAARALRVSEKTVRRWIKDGLLPASRLDSTQGHFRIRPRDIEARLIPGQ